MPRKITDKNINLDSTNQEGLDASDLEYDSGVSMRNMLRKVTPPVTTTGDVATVPKVLTKTVDTSFTVTGSGDATFDGTYAQTEDVNDNLAYKKSAESKYLYRDKAGYWSLSDDTTEEHTDAVYYDSVVSTEVPGAASWVANSDAPAPTLASASTGEVSYWAVGPKVVDTDTGSSDGDLLSRVAQDERGDVRFTPKAHESDVLLHFPDVVPSDDGRLSQAFYETPAVYGNESDGSVTISSPTQINSYTDLTADVAIGNDTLTVRNTTPVGETPFAAGDEVCIMQTQCYRDVSKRFQYEFRTISEINGNAVTVDSAVTKDFDSDSTGDVVNCTKTQLIRVPNYNVLTQNSTIVPKAWDGYSGGISLHRCKVLTGAGDYDVRLRGFRYSVVQTGTAGGNGGQAEGPLGRGAYITTDPEAVDENTSVIWYLQARTQTAYLGGAALGAGVVDWDFNVHDPAYEVAYEAPGYTVDGSPIEGTDFENQIPMAVGGLECWNWGTAGAVAFFASVQSPGTCIVFAEDHAGYTGSILANGAWNGARQAPGGFVALYAPANFTNTVNVASAGANAGVGLTYTGSPVVSVDKGWKKGPSVAIADVGSVGTNVLNRDASDERNDSRYTSLEMEKRILRQYAFDSQSVVDSDPGAGLFKIDNAAPASATFIYINDADVNTHLLDKYVGGWTVGSLIELIRTDTDTVFAQYEVTGPLVDDTGYFKIPVTHVLGTGLTDTFSYYVRRIGQTTNAFSMDTMSEGTDTKILTAAERTKLSNVLLHDQGFFATESALTTAIPTGQDGWHARLGSTDTVWVWDTDTTAWVDTGASASGDMLKSVYAPSAVTGTVDKSLTMNDGAKAVTAAQGRDHIDSATNPHSTSKAHVGLGNVENVKDNLVATVDPTVDDDVTLSYSARSIWINTSTGGIFICVSPTDGAAVWKLLSVAKVTKLEVPGTTKTILPTDITKTIYMQSASASTVTIDTNANQDVELDIPIQAFRYGAGSLTFTAVAGVTLNGIDGGSCTVPIQYAGAVLIQLSADAWHIFGAISVVI